MSEVFMNTLLEIQSMLNQFSSNYVSFGDLTFAQCKMLMMVCENPEISLNTLSELLSIDQSTVSRTLQKVVERGYIMRSESIDDRRVKVLTATEKGIQLIAEFKKGQSLFFSHVFNEINELNQSDVNQSLEDIKKALSNVMSSCEGGC